MTNQANLQKCLGGSPAGINAARLCALTLGALLIAGGTLSGMAQAKPEETKAAKPLSEKKPAAEPAEKIVNGYMVHQSLELGGHITNVTGSNAMWDTLINQGSGARILGQSLELRSVNTSKTPFFDTLTTSSFGYGGDANNVTMLKISKGRIYDFTGSFRRDRQYSDYNLLANSLLGSSALVAEPDSPHLFNTVRRNTDTRLTLLPLSRLSFRAGFNHGTHEGPSYSSIHMGADAQLFQWWRNSSDTWTGGIDLKAAPRTTVSYDQFYVHYKGDTTDRLTGAIFALADGTPVSLGLDSLNTATCGSGAKKGPNVKDGIVNPYCSGNEITNHTEPTRTSFPTEQLRFNSHYWDRVSMNGRILYSGGQSTINNYNSTFLGLGRGGLRQQIDVGGGPGGQAVNNKRVNVNADYGVVADLGKYVSVSDVFNFWDFRTEGSSNFTHSVWSGTTLSTPVGSTPTTVTNTTNANFLNQKIKMNTVLGTFTFSPQIKFSAGYRFKVRNITDTGLDILNFNENWVLLGTVIQAAPRLRLNLNYDHMSSKHADAGTLSNTFTREAPNKINHFRARATVKANNHLTFSGAFNDFEGKNTDVLVNHQEHNRDISFGSQIVANEKLSLDLNFAHDDVYSTTDLCYVSSTAPSTATNSGTCAAAISGDPTYLLGNGYYSAPSTFGSFALMYAPSKMVRTNLGYRINHVDGSAEMLNPLMVPGALQSKYQTPFAEVQLNIAPQWSWRGAWAYNGYTEFGPAGTTAPRDVHGNVLTLSVKYAF